MKKAEQDVKEDKVHPLPLLNARKFAIWFFVVVILISVIYATVMPALFEHAGVGG